MDGFLILLLIGIVAFVVFVAFVTNGIFHLTRTAPLMWRHIRGKTVRKNVDRVAGFAVALLAAVMAFAASPAYAQTATPVPTLNIPTTTIFNEANTWIQVFAPIAAIGIGIAIAIAVLGYVGKMIEGAFK
jgi:hypothetical protein